MVERHDERHGRNKERGEDHPFWRLHQDYCNLPMDIPDDGRIHLRRCCHSRITSRWASATRAARAARIPRRRNRRRRQAKQKSKSERSATKRAAKEAGEQDIESTKSLAARDAERTTVTVTRCEAPSPRANFSLTALPSGELLLFGGEFFDGETNECFNDLFRFSPRSRSGG